MNTDTNLFATKGHNYLYSLIRERNNPKDQEAIAYWNKKYKKNRQYLDNDFIQKFPRETEARLWELTLADFLRTCPDIDLLENGSFGKKKESKPDFCFLHKNKRYFVEATTAHPGTYPELSIRLEDVLGSSCRIPREEYKIKICGKIKDKIELYNTNYHKIIQDEDGFIIAVSSSPIGMHLNPNDYLIELSCVFGLSERQYDMQNYSISFREERIIKNRNKKDIESDYFIGDKHNYLSGVLFSRSLGLFYPQYQDLKGVFPEFEEETIFAHNQYATNQLPIEALPIINQFDSREAVEAAFSMEN